MFNLWKPKEESDLIQADANDARALADLQRKYEKIRPEFNATLERGLSGQSMLDAHDHFDLIHSEFEAAALTDLQQRVAADLSKLTEITNTMAVELSEVRARANQRRSLIGGAFALWLGNVEHDNESSPMAAELAEVQRKLYELINKSAPLSEIYAIAKPLVERILNDKSLRAPILRMPEIAA
jgi:hypothetical protein